MAKTYHQGTFTPKNAEKYAGTTQPIFRSSWELSFMRMCDNHPNVISWASESVKIPYVNPITNKASIYIPDFIVMYENASGKQRAELIEIKPAKETFLEQAKSKRDMLALQVNAAKWVAAHAWAKKHGLTFQVINENHIFRNTKKQKK